MYFLEVIRAPSHVFGPLTFLLGRFPAFTVKVQYGLGLMSKTFERGFSVILLPTTHGTANTDVDALQKVSSHCLIVVHVTASYDEIPHLLEELPQRQ